MRSSLSCDACRRSKVKCVHSGHPPCQRCDKSSIAGCLLSRPEGNGRKVRNRLAPIPATVTAPNRHINCQRRSEGARGRPQHQPESASSSKDAGPAYDAEEVEVHIANLSNALVLKAASVFINNYPELAIIHLPTFVDGLQKACSIESKALLVAILAVTKAQLSVHTVSWAHKLLAREKYALYTEKVLSDLILQPPKIQVVQTLLIITLYEWGSRDFHKAWVYCGIAIRIMQALHSLRVAPYPLEIASNSSHHAASFAIETRTYWACFIMDCMVNSGTYNPPMLPMAEMKKLRVARPPSAVEFAFGPDIPSIPTVKDNECLPQHDIGVFDMTQSFEILVGGFDIWTQVMTFIFNDGRRAPGMSTPRNCPWAPGSPWSLSRSQLEAWRAAQHRRLYFPNNSVVIHMTLGFGETFLYLNLLYYVSTLMLHREYFPFLPNIESEPRGPVDHPQLEAEAPPRWWEESAQLLFGAAENIARLLFEGSECGIHLMTPFTGFCAFSAGYLCLYVSNFPRMNLGRSPDSTKHLKMCLDYLERFRDVWAIGDGWIKTIQQASLLYERATNDRQRYGGRTRDDFDSLHQSIHEFRVIDRSEHHNLEIDGAEQATNSTPMDTTAQVDTTFLLNQLLAEVSSNLDEQGAWSQWWPPIEHVDPQDG